jgi:hypothetical protein
MFHRKTLFVVGAGASAEVELPLGGGLAAVIERKMDVRFEMANRPVGSGDFDLFNRLTNSMRQEVHEYQDAAWLIRDGIALARSIDDFLDMHRDDPFVVQYGKVAIVKSVLEAEHQSISDYQDANGIPTYSNDRFAGTWYTKLMQMLAPGIPRGNVGSIFDNISFVVFNYDRCVEFFLQNALQNLYGITEAEATKTLARLTIIHPYGLIDRSIPFGSTRANYVELADGIKTYTEQITDPQIKKNIQKEIEQADSIVFLGFAYHDQNMLLLQPPKQLPSSKQLFGTAFGMSDSDVEITSRQIDGWFTGGHAEHHRQNMIQIENKLKCAGLFDHYAKSFTARR